MQMRSKASPDAFGNGAMTNSIADIAEAKAVLVIGSNPLEENPLAGRAHHAGTASTAQRSLSLTPKKTATAKQADLYIPCNPGTEVALVNGIMNAILKAGKEKKDFIAAKTKDFEKCKAVVSGAAYSCRRCSKDLRHQRRPRHKSSRDLMPQRPQQRSSPRLAQHSGDLVRAVANLQLLTGNVGKAGAGVDLLRGKSNAQGAMDMGCVPAENGAAVPAMIAGGSSR